MNGPRIELPSWHEEFDSYAPYKVAYGGRGSSKSWTVARKLLLLCATQKKRVLCSRELQNSIQESVHHLLSSQIDAMGLSGWYKVGEQKIVSRTGSEFVFRGLRGMRNDASALKSFEDIDICWIEEGQTVSEASMVTLLPTIRKDGAELWVTMNPKFKTDPCYVRFVADPMPGTLSRKVNWYDNPWFSERSNAERKWMLARDPDAYSWVWGGNCLKVSAAQVLKGKWVVDEFVPSETWDGPYFGVDWGFSDDPTTMVKLWVNDNRLYVEREIWQVGCDIDKTPALFDQIPEARHHVSRADSSRPETISYMQRHGYPRMQSVHKWPGSVEDGIAFLRGFDKIVVHQRCVHTAQECELYSFKTARKSGDEGEEDDILPDIIDKHNHTIDSIRYALQPLIKARAKPPMTMKVKGL